MKCTLSLEQEDLALYSCLNLAEQCTIPLPGPKQTHTFIPEQLTDVTSKSLNNLNDALQETILLFK